MLYDIKNYIQNRNKKKNTRKLKVETEEVILKEVLLENRELLKERISYLEKTNQLKDEKIKLLEGRKKK